MNSRIKFGFSVQQDNSFTEEINERVGFEFYRKAATLAEELGYDSFCLASHWMTPRNRALFDCWSILSALAAVTKRIRLGSIVTPIVAYPPLVLSKQVVTAQKISNGRVIFGVGGGWLKKEFDSFGVEFREHQVRMEMLEEAIQLIRLAWGADESISFKGRYYSVDNAALRPRVPIPPIWVGGASAKALEIAARCGDGWAPNELDHDELKKKVAKLKASLFPAGRESSDFVIAYSTRILARETDEEVNEVLRRFGVQINYTSPTGQRGHMVAGNYEKCAEELLRYIDEGVSYIALTPIPVTETEAILLKLREKVISAIE